MKNDFKQLTIRFNASDMENMELFVTGGRMRFGTFDEISAYIEGYIHGLLEINERSKKHDENRHER